MLIRSTRHRHLAGLVAILLAVAGAQAQVATFTIDNPLGTSWPWDLTYRDFAGGTFGDGPLSVKFLDLTRPAQLERVTLDGRKIDRLWFVATIQGEEKTDSRGRTRRGPVPRKIPVEVHAVRTPSALSAQVTEDYYFIKNGVYEFRLRTYPKRFSQRRQFADVPHWIGGMRPQGGKTWDGRAWYEGNAPTLGAETEIVQSGPVFLDVKITYHFDNPASDQTCQAMPLAPGKQTHTYKPNQLPRETVAKRKYAHEVLVRFVVGDPWIDINERYHLPRDKNIKPWGIHQQWIHWGDPDGNVPDGLAFDGGGHLPVDTVFWERWFEYDKFGGNDHVNFVPARPRPAQKGRPFAQLRPRWNQGGGGAQDFFLTSGGHGKRYDRKTKQTTVSAGYDPDNAAVGVVASFASKWVGPYAQTIAAYAYDGRRGCVRMPMIDGERSGMHHGQRAWGLCVGKRDLFDSTGKMNSLVRRHVDWTLVANMNKYILDWKRDPRLAGPHILITREQIETLRKQYHAGKDTQAVALLRRAHQQLQQAEAELRERKQQREQVETQRKAASGDRAEQLKARSDQLRKQIRKLERELDSDDMHLLRLITEGVSRNVKVMDAGLWLARRYQNDFLNPTQRTTRGMKAYGLADLYAGSRPYGTARQAALGYIHSDLDQWPGWKQGWAPGNPNFHTDKYMVAIYIGAAMLDHPHAREWLAYGADNLNDDLGKVLFAPDGVGYECPGYSGYSFGLQLKIARIIANTGFEDPISGNPLTRKTGIWHRKLITPYDRRIGLRHEAPHGDTHRWTSGMGPGFAKLAKFWKQTDPAFASEMAGTYQLLIDSGMKPKTELMTRLLEMDPDIPPTAPGKMDWSSQQFYGFGAIFRTGFGTDQETFCSIKAGPARGHYHNDEMALHYYADRTPVALDYNCSYHPRGDHAALHNAMTFGKGGVVRHNRRKEAVAAMEQLYDTAWVGAFASTEDADVVVAERSGNSLTLQPVDPHDHEFGRRYPSRKVDPIVHRRFLAMIKHAPDSKLTDYLVVREETRAKVGQQVNLHLLAREAKVDGDTIRCPGQWDTDMLVKVVEAKNLNVDVRQWHYYDEYMYGPMDYAIRPGESMQAWEARMKKLMADNGVDSLPLPGWEPTWQPPEQSGDWFERIDKTGGKALMPPPGWTGKWLYGETQVWLRMHTSPGSDVLWVLYPHKRGTDEPTIESIAGGRGVRVTLGDEVEQIYLATEPAEGTGGQMVLVRDGKEHVLLKNNQVPPLGQIPHKPLD